MTKRRFFIFMLVLAVLAIHWSHALAQETLQERHTMVALRMIGHQMLLRSGDSASLVLPIEKVGERYKLTFQSPFQFEPDALVGLIDSVVRQTAIADRYLVEVKACETPTVVYSYEMAISAKSEMVPCTGRVQPKACYTLWFTIIDPGKQVLSAQPTPTQLATTLPKDTLDGNFFTIALPVVALIGLIVLFYRKKKKSILPAENPEIIAIGAYQFDKRNMTLSVNKETIELTGKEADLLFLLNASANTTIEREVILHAVWGDEGDYAGRTLDVFISKLRKKLEADESLKIVNIRGVGYKLIVND